jgi:hypothetical protein
MVGMCVIGVNRKVGEMTVRFSGYKAISTIIPKKKTGIERPDIAINLLI